MFFLFINLITNITLICRHVCNITLKFLFKLISNIYLLENCVSENGPFHVQMFWKCVNYRSHVLITTLNFSSPIVRQSSMLKSKHLKKIGYNEQYIFSMFFFCDDWSLFRNMRFMLDEMTQRNDSKFAIFYIGIRNPKVVVFSFRAILYFFLNECPGLPVLCRHYTRAFIKEKE